MMNTNEKLITAFYTAFQNKDWETMQACYHKDIVFNDPVFKNLKGNEAKAMWHMLITTGKDLTLEFNSVKANDTIGTAHWEAQYSFSRTDRKVYNVIDAVFEFKEGKIIRHTDSFDLWKWSRMALGLSGMILGWTPMVRTKIRSIATGNLTQFMQKHGVYTKA